MTTYVMGDNLKNTHARVMVLVHDTSSQCVLQMYEVSLKYLYQVIERTRFCDGQTDRQTDRRTDRQKDRQTDARGKQYVSRPLQGGDITNTVRHFLFILRLPISCLRNIAETNCSYFTN